MIRLYFSPMSCSLAVSILLRELGIDFQAVAVDLPTKTLEEDRSSYAAVNPKGLVPALQLEDGELLTEVGPVLKFLADADERRRFIAPRGTKERRRQSEWLSFLSGDLHKAVFYVIFQPDAPEEAKRHAREYAARPLDVLSGQLASGGFLTEHYSVADIFLFVLLCWSEHAGLDFGRWPVLADYRARLMAREAIRSSVSTERALFEKRT